MASIDYGELAKTAGKGFEPLPLGQYEVEVSNAEFKVASTGSPMYKVELSVETGPNAGRKLWTNLVLTDRSAGIFFAKMRAFGLDTAFFAALPAEDTEARICQALVGRHALVTVKHREYQGQTQNEVDKVAPRAGTSTPTVDTQTITSSDVVTVQAPSAAPDLPPGL
jgi:hypothetical protein